MSLICLCVVENIRENDENTFYSQQIQAVVEKHNLGVKFIIDWTEPILTRYPKESFIINVLDSLNSDNCELFLLPDGWYLNGQTNSSMFSERIKVLEDISKIFIERGYCIDWFLGQSGTPYEDYFKIYLKYDDMVNYLSKTVGIDGFENGIHISLRNQS